MFALKLFVIANFLFKSLHSAEADIRKEYLLKRFNFNSTGNWPVDQRSLFDTPLWPDSVLELVEQTSSHYDHFSPTVNSSAEASSKPSEVPINPPQNFTAEDDGQDSDFLDDDINFEQDSERVEGDIDFELYFSSGSEQSLSPQTIHDFLLAADMIQVNDNVGKFYNLKATNSRNKQRKRQDVVNLRNLRQELENIFKSQHPRARYSLRNYTVQNWPEGVDMLKSTWTKQEIEAIRAKMGDFVFVKREIPFDYKTEYGISELGDLGNVLDHSMSQYSTDVFLLNRFREETGDFGAKRIDWSLLDLRAIPSRYNGCVINGKSIFQLSSFYKNPEIVYNIHFSPMDKRNKWESDVDDERTSKKPRNKWILK